MKKTLVVIAALLFTVPFAFAQKPSTASQTPQSDAAAAPASLTTGDVINGPVAEIITDNSAVVGWSTKFPGKGTIKYGLDAKHLDQSADVQQTSEGRNHHAKITGLKPDTNYFFQVFQNGRPAEEVGVFRTVAQGAKPERSKAVIPQ